MALSPLNLGRVSFPQQTSTLLDSLRRNSLAMLAQEGRLTSGRTFNAASEDPGAASQVLDLEGVLGRQDQITANLNHAVGFLDATEAALLDLSGLLSDAHAIASQNIGSLTSAEERGATAELIADILDQMVTVGNRQYNGRYLFGGRDTQQPPFARTEGGVAYRGDTGDLLARVDLEDEEPINLSGDQLFGGPAARVVSTVDLTPRLTLGTRLDEIRTADGGELRLGQLVVSRAATAERFAVDLTSADTLGDIIDLINQAAGTLVTASLTDTGIGLTPIGGLVSIDDTGSGRTAADLGILSRLGFDSPLDGAGLVRRITRTTSIDDLAGGAGVDLSGGLLITNGTSTVAVDLSGVTTIQELCNAVEGAGAGVRASVTEDGTGIALISTMSGTNLSVAENGGVTAAALGLRTYDLTTPLSELNFGRGVETVAGEDDLRITAKDGGTVDVNLDDAQTIGDVIDAINTAAADAGVNVTAGLPETGNGIRITDDTGGAGTLSVSRLNLSFALDDLGLDVSVADAEASELIGRDTAAVRTNNALTALLDLEQALRADDGQAITDAGERVFSAIDGLTRVQGVVGARAGAMQARQDQNASAVFAAEKLVSELRDLDYAEAVTLFQQTQTAFQASLLAGSQSLNLSLLDFLS